MGIDITIKDLDFSDSFVHPDDFIDELEKFIKSRDIKYKEILKRVV
jgi:hypothetical protein